jgi:hypothetical protein
VGAGTQHEQPRSITRRDRPQCDPLGRQLEIKKVGAHAPSYKGADIASPESASAKTLDY